MKHIKPDRTNNGKNAGRQLALNFMVNTLVDYAQSHGLKFPTAVALGSMTSEKKADASRKNGKKGGRPVLCTVCGARNHRATYHDLRPFPAASQN